MKGIVKKRGAIAPAKGGARAVPLAKISGKDKCDVESSCKLKSMGYSVSAMTE